MIVVPLRLQHLPHLETRELELLRYFAAGTPANVDANPETCEIANEPKPRVLD